MKDELLDPQAQNRHCSDWAEITECLDEFSSPEMSIGPEGTIVAQAWVFRGLQNSSFELQPAIEREAQSKSMEWPALELLVSREFRARARAHLTASLIPEDELTWLAQMQHYGIPTRLLDFTYSPFVALYFAIRNGYEGPRRTHVRLWAVNAVAVNDRFWRVASKASEEDQRRKGTWSPHLANLDPDYFATDRDSMTIETEGLHALIAESLSATDTRRGEMNRSGCTCAASPPAFNPRLVSQQGAFLLNCAEDLGFQDSLAKMMKECRGTWCRTFDIPVRLIPDIERQLFQMNIHEQSLFPDMNGLAGLIRQKIRLHWK